MSENIGQLAEHEMDIDESYAVIQDTMDKFLGAADVDAVYGEPLVQGDVTILPTAEILSLAGFGIGSGYGTNQEMEESQVGGGSGGGGGGRVLSRPVAIIVNSPEGVYIEPVIDVTKIALAALTAAGFMVGMVTKMLRSR